MKLQQLRCVCEIVRSSFSVTKAAERLHQSQPGVSRHIHLLEQELGVEIFVRKDKKLVALTPMGKSVYSVANRVMTETKNLRQLAIECKAGAVGELTIATAPTHTRYSLPSVLETFSKLFPRVRLSLREGYGSQSAECVNAGEADISISSYPVKSFPDMVFLPCHKLHRVILTKHEHSLSQKTRIQLADIAPYPIITYNSESLARTRIMDAFQSKGLTINIVLSSYDADTIKRYVLAGLGIAIVAHTVYDPKHDKGLHAIDAGHLFGSSMVHIGLRRNLHLPTYMLSFIELFAPSLHPDKVQQLIYAPSAVEEKS